MGFVLQAGLRLGAGGGYGVGRRLISYSPIIVIGALLAHEQALEGT
jgi:hypothetical protein